MHLRAHAPLAFGHFRAHSAVHQPAASCSGSRRSGSNPAGDPYPPLSTIATDTETNYDALWVRLVTPIHKHLGQVIAYSRANKIVPPWSR